jgi:enoyl-CoA hydratase/carnithine racemase
MDWDDMIELTHRGTVTVLQMTHGKANALDLELCEALTSQLDECQRSSSTQALVLTGTGRMFSAGVDLLRLVDSGASYVRVFLPSVNRLFQTLFAFNKPVVAAVNGHAIAGGCVMVCAADARLMARESGRIGIPELLVGVPFPVVPLEIMRFAAPSQYIQSLAYRGLTLTADEALRHGLVDTVTDPDRLLDEAVAAAEALAALPPSAFTLTKAQLRAPSLQRMSDGASIDAAVQEVWASAKTLAAIRDYIARTFKKPSV